MLGKETKCKEHCCGIDNELCESLRNYIKFLKITVTNYKNYENTVDKTIENNETELNVN